MYNAHRKRVETLEIGYTSTTLWQKSSFSAVPRVCTYMAAMRRARRYFYVISHSGRKNGKERNRVLTCQNLIRAGYEHETLKPHVRSVC